MTYFPAVNASIIGAPTVNIGGSLPNVGFQPIPFTTADVVKGAANATAALIYSASATQKHTFSAIGWSYRAPSGAVFASGNLRVFDGPLTGTAVLDFDIDQLGPGFIPFQRPRQQAAANVTLGVVLGAAGASVVGTLDGLGHYLE
jgi:hypothetical protein